MTLRARLAAVVSATVLLTWARAAPGAPATAAPKDETAIVAAKLTPQGVWLGIGRTTRCFVPRTRGALDAAALEVELRRLRDDERAVLELAGTRGVAYQDVISLMDLAVKVGLVDPRLGSVGEIDARLGGPIDARATTPARCPPPPKRRPTTRPPAARRDKLRTLEGPHTAPVREIPLPPPVKPDLSKLPVVILTRTELTLRGQRVGSTEELAAGKGVVQPLVRALEEAAASDASAGTRTLILQADAATDAAMIERVVVSARAGGYDGVLFAVKNAAPRP